MKGIKTEARESNPSTQGWRKFWCRSHCTDWGTKTWSCPWSWQNWDQIWSLDCWSDMRLKRQIMPPCCEEPSWTDGKEISRRMELKTRNSFEKKETCTSRPTNTSTEVITGKLDEAENWVKAERKLPLWRNHMFSCPPKVICMRKLPWTQGKIGSGQIALNWCAIKLENCSKDTLSDSSGRHLFCIFGGSGLLDEQSIKTYPPPRSFVEIP